MTNHISVGIDKLSGTRSNGGVTYYAHELGAYVTVSETDVARLGAMLEAGEPDAYSVWCSETAYEVAS